MKDVGCSVDDNERTGDECSLDNNPEDCEVAAVFSREGKDQTGLKIQFKEFETTTTPIKADQ